jgi:Tol biopolymer transport system component
MLPLPSIIARPSLRLHAGLLALASVLALGACGTEDTFAPADGTPSVSDAATGADAESAASAITAPATLATARILFTSYRTGRSDVYTMDPSGANVAHLTTTPNHDGEPAWSWDHKQIAFIRGRWNGSSSPFDIYIINADGTGGHWARPYASAWGFREPSWSPDRKRILVRVEILYSKYLGWIDLATGSVKFFNPAIDGSAPSYDAAGQRIVYLGSTWKTIEQINVDGTGHKTRFTSTTSVLRPSFSPDGKKILFERILPNFNREIFVKNLSTGITQRLTTNSASDGSASWSPDGTRIAFASDRASPEIPKEYQIYTMSPTGTDVLRIKTSNTDWEPSWSH